MKNLTTIFGNQRRWEEAAVLEVEVLETTKKAVPKRPGRQESRQAGRKSRQARPGPHLKAAAKAGQARPMQSRAGLAA